MPVIAPTCSPLILSTNPVISSYQVRSVINSANFCTGYTFAGHYVPNLAAKIVEQNKKVHKSRHINFKGFMVRNQSSQQYNILKKKKNID
jgi:carboxypeptidase C (cathepsin A)